MNRAVRVQTEDGSQAASLGDPIPATDATSTARLRSEMLTTFLAQMNAELIPYCLLNGFQGYPEVIGSDVDFMVRSRDAERVAPLLLEVARRCDALLVQAIQHETGAWYFVLAKQEGGAVAYLHPDCSTDYRRDGRLWLVAEDVLKSRQRYKTFFVPSIGDEFLYYLTKKILKQGITELQLHRIGALYLSRPEECRERMRRFWSQRTVSAIEPALARQELGWMRFYLPALLAELRASAPMESGWARLKQRTREGRRKLHRALNPTGLSIALRGGTAQQRAELAIGLEENLRPAFRRTTICGNDLSSGGVQGALSVWLAKVRSTLVIWSEDRAGTRWLERDEVCFVLRGTEVGGITPGRCVPIDGSRSPTQNLEYATRVMLEWLAARLQRRMRSEEPSAANPGTGLRTSGAA